MTTLLKFYPQLTSTKRLIQESMRKIKFQERSLSMSSKNSRRNAAVRSRSSASKSKWRLAVDEIPRGDSLGPYGLYKVDYSKPPPLLTLPPPPPIRTNPFRRYLAAFLAALATGIGVYIYFNPDEGMDEYWTQVERGNVPLTYGKGDSEEDDEYDFDDEEDDDDD